MSKPPLSSVPLLFPALAITAGIAVGTLGGFVYISVAALLAIVLALIRRSTMAVALAAIFLVGLTEGHFLVAPSDRLPTAGHELYYIGEVDDAHISDRGQALKVTLTKWGTDSDSMHRMAPVRIALSVPDFTPEYYDGQTLRILIAPEEITESPDLPDEIEPSSYLLRQHIRYRSIAAAENITVVAESHGLIASLRSWGQKAKTLLFRSGLDADTKIFLGAAILGDYELLDPSTRDTFARAGIAHILALSGLHVGLIALIVSLALYPLVYYRKRNIALALTLTLLWLYAFVTGLSPSVVRAVTMASVYTLARIFQRRHNSLNSLCHAAILILVPSPVSLFNIGFQLSFAAVLSIVLFAEKLTFVSRRNRLFYPVASYLAVSISAMIGTSVLSMFYFHSFPAYFLIANVVASLLLPLLIGAGILILLLTTVGISFNPLERLTDGLYSLLEKITVWVTDLPGSNAGDIFIPAWSIVPMGLSLLLIWFTLTRKKHVLLYLTGLVIVMILSVSFMWPTATVEQRIYAARRTQRTDIVIPTPAALHVLTTEGDMQLPEVEKESSERYRRYMALRGVDSLRVRTIGSGICRVGKLWLINDGKNIDRLPKDMKYLLICRGYRGSVDKLLSHTQADTLIFSADINLQALRHMIEECESKRQPFISLRDTVFSFPYPGVLKIQ